MTSKRILVAEDDAGIVDAVRIVLEADGYEVDTTPNGIEALDRCRKQPPSVLLLDLWIEGLSGKEVCKALKEHEGTKKIPVIVISANHETAKIAEEVGANDFLHKPFDITTLLTKIKPYVKN